jgi:hypothetical protein
MEEAAKKMLSEYYDAMNAQSMDDVLKYLSEDIKVHFADESRNWTGKSTARSKFALMYERNPKFKGEIVSFIRPDNDDVRVTTNESSSIQIIVLARFGSTDDMESSQTQPMRYTVDENLLISSIHH